MAHPLFLMKFMAGGVKARALLNGVQIYRTFAGPTKSAKFDLNPWIVEGTNTIDVYMGPATEIPAGANFDLKVLRQEGEKETKLAAWRWNPTREGLEDKMPVKMWKGEFKVEKAFGRWSWEDAPKGDPSDTDQKQIVALTAHLYKALEAKDANAVTHLMQIKVAEMARAYAVSETQMKEDQIEALKSLFAAKDWGLQSLTSEGLTLIPAAEGRLLVVTDHSGKPPIQATADKKPIVFSLTVSKINGHWNVVR